MSTEPFPINFPAGPGPGEERVPNEEELQAIQSLMQIQEEGYGPLTRTAIETLQQKWGIPVDPEVMIGPRTWANLCRLAAGEEVPAVVTPSVERPVVQPPSTDTDAAIHACFVAAQTHQERFRALKPLFLQAAQESGVAWQIHAAQWSLESAWGTATPSDIETGAESWNFFGIKAFESWEGPKVSCWTWEEENGQAVKVVAYFRAYANVLESIRDHTRLLCSNYYAPVRAVGVDVAAAAHALGPQGVGYATDSRYPEKLLERIAIFESW
jgi:hypothetical protein